MMDHLFKIFSKNSPDISFILARLTLFCSFLFNKFV